MGGQDDEEAAERLAEIRANHAKMRAWYGGDSRAAAAARKELGEAPYPAFWKDVVAWDGWKVARRAYLRYSEGGGREAEEASGGAGGEAGAGGGAAEEGGRKRRSRWAKSADAPTEAELQGNGDDSGSPAKRRSRWARDQDRDQNRDQDQNQNQDAPSTGPSAESAVAAALGIGGLAQQPAATAEQRAELAQVQARLRGINERLANLEVEAVRVDALPRGHRDRSPSPPPEYDAMGKRKNTRAVRWRERYSNARQDCLDKIMELNPAMRPAGYVRKQRRTKIPIPINEHPNYNFIGLILGPRGKTQKELEAKTGCKIAIRGRGSVKEGAKGRSGKSLEGENEPLHVLITGDDQTKLDEAAAIMRDMLVVIDDEKNVHKQTQLRELALLNGTLKDEEYCTTCGEKGHKSFECPKRFSAAGGAKGGFSVRCAICGDTSHPTRDCTMARENQPAQGAAGAGGGGSAGLADKQKADEDYLSFMAELDGKARPERGAAVGGATLVPLATAATSTGRLRDDGMASKPVGSCSAVTTISSTIEGRMVGASGGAAPSEPPIPGTGITIISSIVKSVEPSPSVSGAVQEKPGGTAEAAAPPAEAAADPAAALPPPPPPPSEALPESGATGPPPLPHNLPPPPSTAHPNFPPPAAGLPPPPGAPPGASTNIPPPPPPPPPPAWGPPQQSPPQENSYQRPYFPPPPPPPPPSHHYSQQQQGYGGSSDHQNYHHQQQPPPYGQEWDGGRTGAPPHYGQGAPGRWDYRSYYGSGPSGGNDQGAGGFNWWDAES